MLIKQSEFAHASSYEGRRLENLVLRVQGLVHVVRHDSRYGKEFWC